MIRLTSILSVVLLLVSAAFAGRALAWPGGPGGLRGRHGGPPLPAILERNAERLGLTDETLEQIRAIAAEGREGADAIRAERMEARRRMHDLLAQDAPDEEAVMKQAERMGEIHTKMIKHRMRTLLRIRPLLTAEQMEELHKMRREMRRKRFRGGPGLHGEEPELP